MVKQFLPLAVVITALCIGLYSVGQQVYRQSTYDPQEQLAHDIAATMSVSITPDIISSLDQFHLVKVPVYGSLSPYVIVVDQHLTVVANSSPFPSDTLPPTGVFEAAKQQGVHRLTWEYHSNPRQAIVVVPYHRSIDGADGFVLAGRSMKTVEGRIINLGEQVLQGWIATLFGVFVAVWFVNRITRGSVDR